MTLRAVRKFASLPSGQMILTARIAGLAVLAALIARMASPDTAARMIGGRGVDPFRVGMERDTIVRLVDSVLSHLRPRAASTCVTRSIVVHRLLGEHGIDSRIHFGAHRAADIYEGHVWVEADGVPIGERPDVATRNVSIHTVPECRIETQGSVQ